MVSVMVKAHTIIKMVIDLRVITKMECVKAKESIITKMEQAKKVFGN